MKMTPQEISARILEYLKKCAEDYLGEPVTEAVITVPAYFTNEQRVATREAGILAGFKVDRIINEPTAAALAYGREHMKDEKHVLVFDFGGGTLDVTVLEMFEGVLEVKASSGNNALGGKDLDELLMNDVIKRFSKKHGVDLGKYRKALARLKEAVQKVKIELSDKKSVALTIPFISSVNNSPVAIDEIVTRKRFEKLVGKLIKTVLEPIDDALASAKLKPSDIDTVLLVGGSTRIPMVQALIKDKFGKEPKHEVNPEEAVAIGAAIQAAIMSGEISEKDDIIITDVCPYTLGIECTTDRFGFELSGIFDSLIDRNTTVPVSAKKPYFTNFDNQETALISVYQGEKLFAEQNNFLGDFLISGIPKAPKGEQKLEVEFSYNINGILDVKATIVSSGKDAAISIDTREKDMVPQIDIEKEWKNSKYAKRVGVIIRKAEKMISTVDADDPIKSDISLVIHNLKYALVEDDLPMVRRYEDELTELLYSGGK
jgi:molecular chaperone DnaK